MQHTELAGALPGKNTPSSSRNILLTSKFLIIFRTADSEKKYDDVALCEVHI